MTLSKGLQCAILRSKPYLRPQPRRLDTPNNRATQLRALPFSSQLRPFQRKPFLVPSSRLNSTSASVPTVNSSDTKSEPFSQLPKEQQAAYELTFTCKPCQSRSTHRVSKHGYHKGTVLITCPDCKNRHVIADHLKIFMDKRMTLEDILKEKGAMLKKGRLGIDGDVEFWDDGTKTQRGEGAGVLGTS